MVKCGGYTPIWRVQHLTNTYCVELELKKKIKRTVACCVGIGTYLPPPRERRLNFNHPVREFLWIENDNPTHSATDLLFIDACTHGHLNNAQRLLYTNPTINVSTLSERAFRVACINGHLAKGLQKTQSVFCVEVARWLQSINAHQLICKK